MSSFLDALQSDLGIVILGVILLSTGSALVGCFTFLRKRALVGDAVAHSILPGVCLSFIVSGSKNPWLLLVGAAISGWISLLCIDWITRYSKLKADTAIGLVLSTFFGIGILMLTAIQHSGNAAQAGLDKFLFGKAASMTPEDVYIFGGIALGLIVVVVLLFKEFKLVSFHPEFAKAAGLPVRFIEFVLASLTVLAVSVGIQAVGVVLMAALLITPAAAARFWTDRLATMIVMAVVVGALSGLGGTLVSYSAPSMPTGPWVVMFLSFFAIASAIIAPKKGLFFRYQLQKANNQKILTENILKVFYHLGEADDTSMQERTLEALASVRSFQAGALERGLRILLRKRLINSQGAAYKLTKAGLEESKRVVRLHRLWELYLTQRLNMKADHVHNDAEAIEHVITPELERELEKELNFPSTDPHSSAIPYANDSPLS